MEDKKEEIKLPKEIKVKGVDYRSYHRLDFGSFGEVWLIEKKEDNKKYAMKILKDDSDIEKRNVRSQKRVLK